MLGDTAEILYSNENTNYGSWTTTLTPDLLKWSNETMRTENEGGANNQAHPSSMPLPVLIASP